MRRSRGALPDEAPALRVIATSREALAVPGEIVYRVPSLSLPDAAIPPRDGAADRVGSDPAPPRSSDGPSIQGSGHAMRPPTPLLASVGGSTAFRSRSSSRPRGSWSSRRNRSSPDFRTYSGSLMGGAWTAVARQRTLEATVDWSHQLLSDQGNESSSVAWRSSPHRGRWRQPRDWRR